MMWQPDPDVIRWYLCEINPEPWAVGPVGVNRRGGRISAYVGRNQQLHAYQEAITEELIAQNPTKIAGRVGLILGFWRDRPEYTTPQSRTHRKHDADLTNLQKATEDACQGVLFDNDKDVEYIQAIRVEQGSVDRPRVAIGVFEIPTDTDLGTSFDVFGLLVEQISRKQTEAYQPPDEGIF
jgi:Holliday junction resolvase RusA-like endonuclease